MSHLEQESIVDASCGSSHTLLLSAKGQVYAFGLNTSGQLGLGSENAAYAKPLYVFVHFNCFLYVYNIFYYISERKKLKSIRH